MLCSFATNFQRTMKIYNDYHWLIKSCVDTFNLIDRFNIDYLRLSKVTWKLLLLHLPFFLLYPILMSFLHLVFLCGLLRGCRCCCCYECCCCCCCCCYHFIFEILLKTRISPSTFSWQYVRIITDNRSSVSKLKSLSYFSLIALIVFDPLFIINTDLQVNPVFMLIQLLPCWWSK